MLKKLEKAFKQAMGERHYNTWIESIDKINNYQMTLEEYEKTIADGNYTMILDIKKGQVIFYDKTLNMTTVAYIDEEKQ